MSTEFENSITVISAEITNLVEMMRLQDKELMEKQLQNRQNAEQKALLIAQVKTREVEMKHLIEAACDGAKGISTPVASF